MVQVWGFSLKIIIQKLVVFDPILYNKLFWAHNVLITAVFATNCMSMFRWFSSYEFVFTKKTEKHTDLKCVCLDLKTHPTKHAQRVYTI